MELCEYQTFVKKDTGRTYIRKVKGYKVDEEMLVCSSPDAVYNLIESAVNISSFAEEVIYAVYVNTKNRVLGISRVSHGTVNSSIISPREVFIRALMLGATGLIIVHNHPSQDVTPSKEDKMVTQRLADAGRLMNIRVSDHVIIGSNYYSFRENGGL